MVAVGPVLTIQMLHDCLYPEGCLKKTGVCLLGSVIGLAANPLFWIGCIFYLLPKGVAHLYHRYTDRREEEERREYFLQQRLLSE